jgi:hypothetical protein
MLKRVKMTITAKKAAHTHTFDDATQDICIENFTNRTAFKRHNILEIKTHRQTFGAKRESICPTTYDC